MKPFEPLRFGDVPEQPRVPHRWFELPSRTIAVRSRPFGDVEVRVRISGEGPPLLLVHGLMTSGYSWRYALDRLPGFTLYIPDLLGSGGSTKPDASYAPDRLAESVAETIDALGIRGCAAIGNSLGGYLLMRMVLRDSGALSRLSVLHAPGLRIPRMTALRLAFRVIPKSDAVLRWLLSDPERWVHRNVHYWDETLKSREEHREYAVPLRTPEGVRAFWHVLRDTMDAAEMDRFEMELRERGFPIPLQLVYAKRDPMVPPVVGERLRALLPAAEFVQLDAASHFAHVDAPDAFAAAVLPFLRAGGP